MKEHFPDVSALNKKYNNLIYWTYSKKVDRQSYVLDTKNFIHTSYNIFKSKPKYFFVDLIQMKLASIKKLILKIKNTTKFYYYENNRMIYIYCDNFIFGIDKELLIYIGLDPVKIFNKIKKLSNGTLVKNDIITLPIEDLQKIDLSFFDEINFDYTETKSVVFCSEKSIKSFLKNSKVIGFSVIIEEASDMLFMNEIDLSKADNTFKGIVKNYLKNTYSVDDVLDKILKNGIGCLSESDKFILK
jgi:hypothetical protein